MMKVTLAPAVAASPLNGSVVRTVFRTVATLVTAAAAVAAATNIGRQMRRRRSMRASAARIRRGRVH